MKVLAEDKDPGENGRVTYHFKVGNNNTQTTDEFSIDENTGELRTIVNLDRERKSIFQVIYGCILLVPRFGGGGYIMKMSTFSNFIMRVDARKN